MSRNRSPMRGRMRGGRGEDRARDGNRERERGPRMVNGRPRKTQEELDKEMEDYWGGKQEEANGGAASEPAPDVVDDDVDMIT